MESIDAERADASNCSHGDVATLGPQSSSRHDLRDSLPSLEPPKASMHSDPRTLCEKLDVEEEENSGAKITKPQQWKSLIATILQSFWVLGLSQSFGIWQRHYGSKAAVKAVMIDRSDMTQRATIAAIGSLSNGGLVAVFGMLWLPYLPWIGRHIKTLCMVATAMMAIGFVSAACCQRLWQLTITQGFFVGLGCGIWLYTLPQILPEYFDKNVGLAQGAGLAAASVGGTVLSLLLPKLLQAVGTRWTLNILAITSFVLGAVVSLLAQPPRDFKRRSTKIVGFKNFKDPTFALLSLVNLLHPLTLANPMTFGPEFSDSLGFTNRMGAILLAIGSAVGFPSRLISGHIADRIGHQNMLFLAYVGCGLGTWGLWLSAAHTGNKSLWVAFVVLYGIMNGVFNTVINSIQKRSFGSERYYPYSGAMTSIRGIAYVAGVPIAGSLVSRVADVELSGRDFTNPIVYTGVLLIASAMCIAGLRWVHATRHGWKWIG